jgi:hypothetical protein
VRGRKGWGPQARRGWGPQVFDESAQVKVATSVQEEEPILIVDPQVDKNDQGDAQGTDRSDREEKGSGEASSSVCCMQHG